MPADAHLGAPERAQRAEILRVDVARDEPRDQFALRRAEDARGVMELRRLGGRDPHEERSLVRVLSWPRHCRYLDIKKISATQVRPAPGGWGFGTVPAQSTRIWHGPVPIL